MTDDVQHLEQLRARLLRPGALLVAVAVALFVSLLAVVYVPMGESMKALTALIIFSILLTTLLLSLREIRQLSGQHITYRERRGFQKMMVAMIIKEEKVDVKTARRRVKEEMRSMKEQAIRSKRLRPERRRRWG